MRLYTRGWTPVREGALYVNDRFLTRREVDHLLRMDHAFRSSHVDDQAGDPSYASYRTSQSAPVRQDATVTRIMQRAAETLGVTHEHVEPPQVVRYAGGDQFETHHDNGVLVADGSVEPSAGPQRTHTIFCYLLSPERGGETDFPALGARVQPRPAGRCVLFRNVLPGGANDPRAVHAGLPPEAGEKVGMNIWISVSQ